MKEQQQHILLQSITKSKVSWFLKHRLQEHCRANWIFDLIFTSGDNNIGVHFTIIRETNFMWLLYVVCVLNFIKMFKTCIHIENHTQSIVVLTFISFYNFFSIKCYMFEASKILQFSCVLSSNIRHEYREK